MNAMIYMPRNMYTQTFQLYYIYIQPVILFTFILLQTAVIRLLNGRDFFQFYGLLTLFTCFELFSFLLQDIFLVIYFTAPFDYILYEWCYTFKIGTSSIPIFSLAFSQWLRVGQGLQRFIVIYKPITQKSYLRRRNVVIYCITSCLLSLVVAVMNLMYEINFEPVFVKDVKTNTIIRTCRESDADMMTQKSSGILRIVTNSYIYYMPFILSTIAFTGTIYHLRKQMSFRKQNSLSQSNVERSMERLIKITTWLAILLAISSLPTITLDICMLFIHIDLNDMTKLSVVDTGMSMFSMFSTFLLLLWMTKDFRVAVKRIKSPICNVIKKCNKCSSSSS